MERAYYNLTNNRLFFWPDTEHRLPPAEYEACKAAGFTWWPRGCFTCVWRPQAEDWIRSRGLAIEENDEPDDVEGRVERYQGYAENAAATAASASERAATATTARRERLASNVAEREVNNAQYWQRRIAGAIGRLRQHDAWETCQNRVKNLEADKRKHQRTVADWEKCKEMWYAHATSAENVEKLLGFSRQGNTDIYIAFVMRHEIDWETAKQKMLVHIGEVITHSQRWIEHLDMRLEYERAYAAAIHSEAVLENPKRRVTPTPQDGLKKGDKVKGDAWLRGKMWYWDATILSLGPKTVTVDYPPEIEATASRYMLDNRLKLARSRVVKVVAQEVANEQGN